MKPRDKKAVERAIENATAGRAARDLDRAQANLLVSVIVARPTWGEETVTVTIPAHIYNAALTAAQRAGVFGV
jgi:hypothetical protein